jgi:hypothetical protein
MSLLLFVCAFGIYLGRYLRWNSWDIISSPLGLAKDIAIRILNPGMFPGAWGMTLMYGAFLNIAYISFRKVRKMRKERAASAGRSFFGYIPIPYHPSFPSILSRKIHIPLSYTLSYNPFSDKKEI